MCNWSTLGGECRSGAAGGLSRNTATYAGIYSEQGRVGALGLQTCAFRNRVLAWLASCYPVPTRVQPVRLDSKDVTIAQRVHLA